MLQEFLIFGGFWFWLLVAIEFCVLLAFVATENEFGGVVSLLVVAGLLQWGGGYPIYQTIIAHPWYTCLGALGYLIVAALWSTFKWYLFVKDKHSSYEEDKIAWLLRRNVTGTIIPSELKTEWKEYAKRRAEPPQVRDYKSQIIKWMTLWPFSFIWFLISDFVTQIFKAIYARLAHRLQAISDHIYAGVKDDFE